MNSENTGWQTVEILSREKLDDFAWHKGFFIHSDNPNLWKRNFEELRQRDIALFTLGDLNGKSVLDIGCGAGLYVLTMLKMGAAHVAGQDLSESAVQLGKRTCAREGYTPDLKVGDCTKLQFESNSFDAVFSGDVFEHITDDQKLATLKEIYRVLRPGGIVTIKTPNLSYLKAVVFLKRLIAPLRLRNPFNIHVCHTRNNPDNEHHGLTTHRKLIEAFEQSRFHAPTITTMPLRRKGVPMAVSKAFERNLILNDTIILTARKPLFLGIYN